MWDSPRSQLKKARGNTIRRWRALRRRLRVLESRLGRWFVRSLLLPSRRSLFPPRWMSIDLVIGILVRSSAQWNRPIPTQSSGNFSFFLGHSFLKRLAWSAVAGQRAHHRAPYPLSSLSQRVGEPQSTEDRLPAAAEGGRDGRPAGCPSGRGIPPNGIVWRATAVGARDGQPPSRARRPSLRLGCPGSGRRRG